MNNIIDLILMFSGIGLIFAVLGLMDKIPYIDSKIDLWLEETKRRGKNELHN